MATDPNYLRVVSCFRDLSDEQLESLAQITDALCYPPGQTLFKENKPGKRLFFWLKEMSKFFIALANPVRCA